MFRANRFKNNAVSILAGVMIASMAFSQNLQVHYDFGDDRDHFTTTLEMFKPDSHGANFWFVDMDYNSGTENAISLMYWEYARYFALPVLDGASFTIQYNDGIADFGNLGQIWLAGISKQFTLFSDFQLSTDILYRDQNGYDTNGQITLTWFKPIFDGKFSFTGFCDIWTTEGVENNTIYLAEPQLWVHLSDKLAVGTEIEISKNFLPGDDVEFMPTFGIKWEF